MKTLYVSDLDGTLLNSDKQITERTAAILKALQGPKFHFSIATARTAGTVCKILKDIHFEMPVILMNGVVLYDLNKRCYVDVEYICEESLKAIKEVLQQDLKKAFIYTIENQKLTVHYEEPLNPYQQAFYDERKNNSDKLFIHEDVKDNKRVAYVVFLGEKEEIGEIYEKIKNIPGLEMSFYKDIYTDKAYLLEVYSHLATKAKALVKLKKKYEINHVICFGDQLNDLNMFALADEGYAVSNAAEEVKAKATAIIESNNEDGVARFIEQHIKGGDKDA